MRPTLSPWHRCHFMRCRIILIPTHGLIRRTSRQSITNSTTTRDSSREAASPASGFIFRNRPLTLRSHFDTASAEWRLFAGVLQDRTSFVLAAIEYGKQQLAAQPNKQHPPVVAGLV